jgi:hypothetical protein
VAGAGDLDRMAASADRVWDLASDITRVGEISPETFEAEWPGGASGPGGGGAFPRSCPAQRPGAGVLDCLHGGGVRSGPRVRLRGGRGGRDDREHVGATSWNPARGTDVTESFELADTPLVRLYWMVAGFARSRTNLEGIRVSWKGSRQSPNPSVLPGRPDAEAPGCRCATCLQNAVHGRAPGGIRVRDGGSWPCQL